MNKRIKKFTLVEIMMAVMISSVIVIALGSVTFSVTKSYQAAERKASMLKEYCKIDRLVDNLFRNAVPFSWVDRQAKSGFRGLQNPQKLYFIGDENYLLLSSKQPIFDNNDTGFIFSEFFVENNQLKVRYKSTPFMQLKNFEAENNNDGNIEIITSNVQEINFKYAKVEDNQTFWNNNFIEQQNATDNDEVYDEFLPLAIQISIKWNDGREKHWLRRTAGSSRYSAWGRSDINPVTGRRLNTFKKNK